MKRRGFTLLDMLMVVLIIGVLAALGMDLLGQRDGERLRGVARMLEQDIEWARSATLSDPDDPASIRLLDDGSGWLVVRASDTDTPATASDGSLMLRTLGEGMAEAAAGVQVVSTGTRTIEFEAFGGVRIFPATLSIVLPDSESQCLVTCDPASGAMQVTWPNP